MKDRYRIIKHEDYNGVVYYTVQIQCVWMFGLKFWRSAQATNSSGDCSTPMRFDSLIGAQKFVRGTTWTRTIVEEGVI